MITTPGIRRFGYMSAVSDTTELDLLPVAMESDAFSHGCSLSEPRESKCRGDFANHSRVS